jgi:hypothetical protein
MHERTLLSVAFLFTVGASAPAAASVMTLVGGTLGVSVTLGGAPTLTVNFPQNLSAVPIAVSSGGGSFVEPASIFTGSVMLPTSLFTGVALIDGLTLANLANGAKSIAQGGASGPRTQHILRAGGGLGGPGPLDGTLFVNILALFNLAVPLDFVGSTGGQANVTAGSLLARFNGTGWTTGPVLVTGITSGITPPTVVNTVTFSGYETRTPNHQGVVQLISPFKVITNAVGNLPGVAVQTLTFVPEPGMLVLIAAGALGLAVYARRRG